MNEYQNKLILELQVDLKIAEEKEALARKENKAMLKIGDSYQISVKFSNWTEAQGKVNGILESIDTVRRTQ